MAGRIGKLVWQCRPRHTLYRVGSLPGKNVITNTVIGLISDSDVVARVQPARQRSILDALRQLGKPPAGKETAANLMSHGTLTAAPDCSIADAVQKMLAESRKWLVVVDEKNRPLGLVERQSMFESLASFYPPH